MVAQLDRDVIRAKPSRVVPRLLSYALFEGRPATTRGRWFNPLVRANLSVAGRLATTRPVNQPIFVVGIGRSGTTLLGRLLGVHSEVGFLNEPKAMWHRIVSDEDLIGSYGPEPVRLRLGPDDATAEVRDRASRLFGWYLTMTRSRRLVDKYPELIYRTGFIRAVFPDAHIVAIVRRPWDVITSIEAWEQSNASSDADWWGIDDRKWRVLRDQALLADPRWSRVAAEVDAEAASPVIRAAIEWLIGTAEAIAVSEELGGPGVHLVRYEDLIDDPREFMASLLETCGLEVEEQVLDLAADSVARQRPQAEPLAEVPPALSAAIDEVAAAAGYV